MKTYVGERRFTPSPVFFGLVGITLAGLSVLGAGLLGAPSLAPVSAAGILAVVVVAYRLSLRPVTRLLSERRVEVFRALGVG